MKKLLTISAATLLAAFAMTGCKPPGSTETLLVIAETEEKTGNEVVVTKYEYNPDGSAAREVRTKNGSQVYEIKDFAYSYNGYNEYVYTRYRTNADGSVHKLVSTLGYVSSGGEVLETEYEATDANDRVIEYKKLGYNDNGMASYDEFSVNGDESYRIVRSGYNNTGGAIPVQTYRETKTVNNVSVYSDVPMRLKITRKDSRGDTQGYELYYNSTGDDDGIKIEEKVGYESSTQLIEWDIKKYDAEGSNSDPMSTTHVKNTFKYITVEYRY